MHEKSITHACTGTAQALISTFHFILPYSKNWNKPKIRN